MEQTKRVVTTLAFVAFLALGVFLTIKPFVTNGQTIEGTDPPLPQFTVETLPLNIHQEGLRIDYVPNDVPLDFNTFNRLK